MAYEIEEAKRLVVEAGKRLVQTGLIARTWGNVSARISDTQFVITPSGRAYEDLTPEEIVVVRIAHTRAILSRHPKRAFTQLHTVIIQLLILLSILIKEQQQSFLSQVWKSEMYMTSSRVFSVTRFLAPNTLCLQPSHCAKR